MINKFDVKNLYRALHSTTGKYIFFPKSHITFTKADVELRLKTNIKSQKSLKDQFYKTVPSLS